MSGSTCAGGTSCGSPCSSWRFPSTGSTRCCGWPGALLPGSGGGLRPGGAPGPAGGEAGGLRPGPAGPGRAPGRPAARRLREHDVSRRVKGALAYKKPAVLAAAVLAAVAVAVGLWLAADASGGAGLPGRPPGGPVPGRSDGELSAAGWDGEEGPDPAALLADAPCLPTTTPGTTASACSSRMIFHIPTTELYRLPAEGRGVGGGGDPQPHQHRRPVARADATGDGRLEERGVLITYTWREGFEGRSAPTPSGWRRRRCGRASTGWNP